MHKLSLGLVLATLAIAGGCKKKNANPPANGSAAGSNEAGSAAAGSATGGTNTGASATGGTNSGTTTNGTTASTQTGCVNKLGAEMPQGDIKLTAACGPVTVEGEVTIDAKLTIEPGVTISFVEGASLGFGYNNTSSLIAQGTAEKPITFTAAGTKTPGWWKGIRLYSHDKRSVLDHVVVEFSGGEGDDGYGIRADSDVKELTITNSEFRSIKGTGIVVDGEHALAKIEGNTFKDTSAAAIRIHPDNLPELGANNLGDKAVELLNGRLSRSATLHAPGTYRLRAEVTVERGESNASVPVLTVEPGVVVEGVDGAELAVGYNNGGTLVAKGTADKPITFTSFDKKKGSWKGIELYDKAKDNVIQHAVVEFATSDDSSGAVRVRDEVSLDIADVTFAHLDGVGLSGSSKKLTAKNLKADDAKGTQAKPE